MIRTAMLVLCLAFAACTEDPGPTVMRLVGSSPGLSEVSTWTMAGRRDGARTRATAVLHLTTGQRLQVDFVLEVDPAPAFVNGTWSLDDQSGTVSAERVRFVGGQGEGPSAGGDFVLVDARNLPRYRVTLPLTPLDPAVPRPQ